MPIKSDAQRKAVAKYNAANYEQILLRVEKGSRDIIADHAKSLGESLNAFINRAISETMIRDAIGSGGVQACPAGDNPGAVAGRVTPANTPKE